MSYPDQAPTTWVVTGQSQATDIPTQGAPVNGVRIQYRTGNGQEGSVFVPQTIYPNTSQVRDIIAAAAAQMDTVKALTSETPLP